MFVGGENKQVMFSIGLLNDKVSNIATRVEIINHMVAAL